MQYSVVGRRHVPDSMIGLVEFFSGGCVLVVVHVICYCCWWYFVSRFGRLCGLVSGEVVCGRNNTSIIVV